jgi:hypothetical protein
MQKGIRRTSLISCMMELASDFPQNIEDVFGGVCGCTKLLPNQRVPHVGPLEQKSTRNTPCLSGNMIRRDSRASRARES